MLLSELVDGFLELPHQDRNRSVLGDFHGGPHHAGGGFLLLTELLLLGGGHGVENLVEKKK